MKKAIYDYYKKNLYHIYKKMIKYQELTYLCFLIKNDLHYFKICKGMKYKVFDSFFRHEIYFHKTIEIASYYDVIIEIINKFGVKFLLDIIHYTKENRDWYRLKKDGLYTAINNKLIISFAKNGCN